MFYLSLLVPLAVAFLATYLVIPAFMRFFLRLGVIATDVQKPGKPSIPIAGGIPVFFGFTLGTLLFIAANTFVTRTPLNLVNVFAAILSASLITLVGFFDDLNVMRRKVAIGSGTIDYKVGLAQWQKPLLTLAAAVPLMAVSAGVTKMSLPLLGEMEFGVLYPLVLIPVAVVCVSNATNMLAGINGLEAGSTSIALAALGGFLWWQGRFEGAAIALCAVAAQLAFLKFNWFPAKIFPGDSLTYFSGAVFVSAVIIGNAEKLGIIIFTPWIIEAFLKLRGRFKFHSYGNLQRDGSLKAPYKKIYSLTHVAMKLPRWLGLKCGFKERQIALLLILFEAIACAVALAFTVKLISV